METIERLIQIIKQNAPEILTIVVPPATCWLDGDRCPYGSPNGRFNDRPRSFCVVPTKPGTGCYKLLDFVCELDQMSNRHIESETEKQIDEWIDENNVTLSSELRTVADEQKEGVDKETLMLAAEIIEAIAPLHKIVRVELDG